MCPAPPQSQAGRRGFNPNVVFPAGSRSQGGRTAVAGPHPRAEHSILLLEGIVLPTDTSPSISLKPQATDPVPEAQGPAFYLLSEISITIQESDLTRAATRAAILQTVTGVRTQPLLTGAALEEGLDTAGVMFLEIPDFA